MVSIDYLPPNLLSQWCNLSVKTCRTPHRGSAGCAAMPRVPVSKQVHPGEGLHRLRLTGDQVAPESGRQSGVRPMLLPRMNVGPLHSRQSPSRRRRASFIPADPRLFSRSSLRSMRHSEWQRPFAPVADGPGYRHRRNSLHCRLPVPPP